MNRELPAFLGVLLLVMLSVLPAAAREKPQPPDAIFLNGDIWTGAWHDAMPGGNVPHGMVREYPRAQAIAVRGERIIAVASNPIEVKELLALRGPHTEVIDLGGHFVMPGFHDAHMHLASGGLAKLRVDLVGAQSLAQMLERIAAQVRKAAPGEWIQGRGWDHTLWQTQGAGEAPLPTRQDLDRVTAGHPAIFRRVDGHIVVVNTAALQAAGITRDTPAPQGGKIDHDAQGEPTGILREGAADLVVSKMPTPTKETQRRGIELALEDAREHGITSLQDNSSWEAFLIYEQLEREGRLTVRISEWLAFDDSVEVLRAHRAHHPAADPLLHTGMLKGFMDGSLGSRTAALLAPYADDPKNLGLPQYEPAKLNRMAEERAAAGFQMGFHAIGDGGAELALDAFEQAQRYAREHAVPGAKLEFRNRIEHAQVTNDDQLRRMAALHVIASVQPNHLLTDMHWAESRIGPERAAHSYAWREMLQNGIHLAFGTDYPVEPMTPFRGLYAAVTRKSEDGTKSYYPEQTILRNTALEAYTAGGAYAEFEEKEKGILAPGMLADFVVLDRDLEKCEPEEILKTKVLRTVVGGRTVFNLQ